MTDTFSSLRLVLLFVLSLMPLIAQEAASKIDSDRAVALAEQFVLEKGMMNPPVNAKRGDPEHLFFQGKIEPKAWGYQKLWEGTEDERWRVLFPITASLIKAKGNETAWGMLVVIDRAGEKIFVNHEVTAAYDGKPFVGFTPVNIK